ncbi:exonuclease mut [Salix suchowensis]|nr:exonuclease mut [Salix suchowensis]
MEEGVVELHDDNGKIDRKLTISAHTFSDLTYTSPVVFLYLLKECYAHGTCKATNKFRILQQKVYNALENSPQPGPATFAVWCLYVLPIFGLYCEGLSHLIISALRRFLNRAPTSEDTSKAKVIAAQLFLDIVGGLVDHDERIVLKILEVFDVKLTDIDEALCHLKVQDDYKSDRAKTLVEEYILKLTDSQSYMTAASLLEHFSIRQSGQPFLVKMMQNKQSRAAEKWATFMGKSMLCALVREYVDQNMLKQAYKTIKKNNLKQEFPDVYHKCKESLLKNLAEKALWDLAEAKTHGDKQLLEYLVSLAMEAGYLEKVDELCERYSLEGFLNVKESEASVLESKYLRLDELAFENIIWVDEVDGLCAATSHIEECKVVGLDCEWKPNYVKGSKPNKVSIMQIASDKMVFIFDLIKLFEDVPEILDNCLTRILQSPRILKLGYNFQCDMRQLAHSYGDLKCFNNYEKLLDVQNVFKEARGGLSGLAEKILGTGLNKTRRNSDWELRPLSQNQLEYAALDAAVLVHIFQRVHNHSQTAGPPEAMTRSSGSLILFLTWITPIKQKRSLKIKRELEDDTNNPGRSN